MGFNDKLGITFLDKLRLIFLFLFPRALSVTLNSDVFYLDFISV